MPVILAMGSPWMTGLNVLVAGGRRGGMRPVAVVVTCRVELIGVGPDEEPVRLEHLPSAQQLVVAGEGHVVRVVRGVAELARHRGDRGRPVGAVVGERGVLRPDAGVDDADHDVLAGEATGVGAAPCGEPQELAAAVGRWLPHLVFEDVQDALLRPDRVDLLRRQNGGVAVERDRVVVQLGRRPHAGRLERLVVFGCQELLVLPGRGGVDGDSLALGGLGSRVPGESAFIRRDRGPREDHDVRLPSVLRQDRGGGRGRQRQGQ